MSDPASPNIPSGPNIPLGQSQTDDAQRTQEGSLVNNVPQAESQQAATVDSLIGQIIDGKYRVVKKLGQGGMGAVFRGEHELMERPVALKVLHPHLVQNPELLKRFQHEARVASKLRHPNAIATYDYGMFQGSPFLVMEFVEGRTLRELIAEEGPLPVQRVISIFRQAGSALAQAHSLGIIHRDLKPDNVMLVPQADGSESAVVLDFGIAKVLTEQGSDRTVLTQAGTFFGTPRYASPEQAAEKQPDRRSDIYALGIMMYEALSGEVPFNAPSVMELLIKHLQQKPVPLRKFKPELKISEAMDSIVMKCLRKRPEDRFQTIGELLEAFGEPSPLRGSTGSVVSAPSGLYSAAQTSPNRGPVWIVLLLFFAAAGAAGWYFFAPPAKQIAANSQNQTNTSTNTEDPGRKQLLDELVQNMDSTNATAPTKTNTATPPNNASVADIASGLGKLFNQGDSSKSTSSSAQQVLIPADTVPISGDTAAPTPAFPVETANDQTKDPANDPTNGTATPKVDPLNPWATADKDKQGLIKVDSNKPPQTSDDPSKQVPADSAAAKREAIARYDSGMKFYRQRRYAEAAAQFEAAVQLRSDAVGSYISLGNCYQRMGQNDRALRAFQNATRIDPKYGPAHYNLAAFYALTGQTANAVDELRTTFRLDPRARRAVRDEPDFDSLRSNPEFRRLME